MEVWGGENLELSFKAWMCPPKDEEGHDDEDDGDLMTKGPDRIEILPCSRVGHVFRTWSPYNTEGKQILRNNIRVAEVWLDGFKYIFFDRYPNLLRKSYEKEMSARNG